MLRRLQLKNTGIKLADYKLLMLFYLLMVFPAHLKAQITSPIIIEGKIEDKTSRLPLAYAAVMNKSTGKGTISNQDGYFRLQANKLTDTIVISLIGYKKTMLRMESGVSFYNILLEENYQQLGEVKIIYRNNAYLYDLIATCKKNQKYNTAKAKVYYELKSMVDSKQVELVECFYNGRFSGCDIERLDLKTGRIALQQYNEGFFVSMESSRALSILKLYGFNDNFPHSPLQLSRKKLKKQFYLQMENKYITDTKDSVYVITFTPKDTTGTAFHGKIWINHTKKSVLKIKLVCVGAKKHPFLPLFSSDTIKQVDFDITKTFDEVNGKMSFRHINFSYALHYKNRNQKQYNVSTSAVLYAYDYHNSFILPYMNFQYQQVADYRKINAIPYNNYFWEKNEELKLHEQHNNNEAFFNDTNTYTNKYIFSPNSQFSGGLLEHKYISWDGNNRIVFREFTADTSSSTPESYIMAEKYKLSVKLFLDINPLSDTLQFTTATIFDPYESYYRLPMDDTARCFINIYFDIYEIERRKLEAEINNSDRKIGTIQMLYENSQKRIARQSWQYLTEVQTGRNKKALEKWNHYVSDALGINNMALFKPYSVR